MPVNDNTMGRDPLRPMDLLETDATKRLFAANGTQGQAVGYPEGDVSHMPQQPQPGQGATPSPLEFTASTDAGLDALKNRYNTQLDNIQNNTGRIMDQRASRFRDIREGGANALSQGMTQAGKASDPAQAGYAAATAQGEQRAVTDVGQEQQNAYTSALQGGVAVNRAPADLALDEKRFQLSAYTADKAAQNQDAQTNLQALQAMLNDQRSSPIYSGTGAAPIRRPSGPSLGAFPTSAVQYGR